MKTLLVAAAAALALASVTGCDDYYVEGRAPATAYGQSSTVLDESITTPGVGSDSNLAVSADMAGGGGQDVVIGANSDEYTDTDPSALTDFRTTLDPYGSWVDDPTYGTVWVPSTTVVGTDFSPYVTAGHWTYGDDYVWVSDYEWGWAPFHYGRWTYINSRGWGWIPGRTYAGAWVTWRTGYDGWGYVGWAPMPPAWGWRGGYAVGLGVVPYAPYTFCAHGDVFAPSVATRVVSGQQVGVIAGHTRPFTPATPGVGGPGRTPGNPGVGGGHLGPQRMGPPPSDLGLSQNQISRAPAQDRGLMRANQFSRPSTATSIGARAPATFASNGNSTFHPSTTVATSPSYNRPAGTPQYRSVPFGTSPTYRSAPSYQPSQHYSSTPSYSHTYTPPSYSHSYTAPSYSHSAPSYSAPSYSHPSYSAPSYSAPSHSYGGGGGGGYSHSSGFSGSRGGGGGGRGGGHR